MSRRFKNAYPRDFFGDSTPARETSSADAEVIQIERAYERQYGKRDRARAEERTVSRRKDLPELMSAVEVAEHLKRYTTQGKPHAQYVNDLIRAGKLKGFKEGKYYKVFVSDFAEYIEKLRANKWCWS